MRSKILQKLSRHRIKVLVLLFVTGFLFYSLLESLRNYDWIANEEESFSLASSKQSLNEQQQSQMKTDSEIKNDKEQDPAQSSLSNAHKFWKRIFTIFDENRMNLKDRFGALIEVTDKSKHLDGPKTKEALLSRATMSDEVVSELKRRHELVVSQLPTHIAEATYNKGTTGVVFIGGAKFSWLTYLAILALRETGTKLPVEVIMPKKSDYTKEQDFCDNLLPELGARCVIVPDTIGESALNGRSLFAYQFKSIALAISSFQHILLLDSDNIIVSNPDLVFDSPLYKKYGMITWPDYWKRTIYPKYYDIAGIHVNERKRARYDRFPLFEPVNSKTGLNVGPEDAVPYHDLEGAVPDLSTESGQLIINKATHGKTILLSLYYNIYGPDVFYKLFSLGEQGEGDKDTFVTAAIVCNEPHYSVKSFILSPGYFDNNNKFNGVAMAQKNPLSDYNLFNELVVNSFTKSGKTMSVPDQINHLDALTKKEFDSYNKMPIFAIHCNHPKIDPVLYMQRGDIYDSKEKRLRYRLYNGMKYDKTVLSSSKEKTIETDFEYEQWLHIQNALCVRKLKFEHFKDLDADDLCEFVNNQVKWLSPGQQVNS
ncbi:Mnn3 predicted Golgi alpha-1,2-mannosyltransferase [Candida orthopsilosis Co 90-125]|uniref:Mnn3 predicted Golgi alpha-1,2-mannosyltransferase n=1 Tax=Candida orthopsilosis (strain 90-125) TaxID=1136231 RepID=H8WXZ4_CANO9|nr:Mnn3 predicted Golgi alpha-1,2-mannosyltransferase [Candida orthopsilosis Co 90-125]CCG20941.1 Mnn3 predicted Golgi alpha-1,2-mannosyltransferase [Candida orthopsilosis Co 90-125]